MTSKEFIDRVLDIGYDVHFNDDVWWIKIAPYYYEPVIPYQVIERGAARPNLFKALLGYSHIVPNWSQANKTKAVMLLNEEKLRSFGMSSLPSKRRNKVKKGLRLTESKKIDDIEAIIDDIKEILVSKAERTKFGDPADYYTKNYDDWKATLIKQFNIDKGQKEYWGSFYKGKLIAFFTMIQIDDLMIITNGSSHSAYLNKCPNDALRFDFLEYCRKLKDCRKIISGLWSETKPSLNEFKESFGFERVELPVYARYNLNLVPIAKKFISLKNKLSFHAPFQGNKVPAD